MKFIIGYIRAVDKFNENIGKIASWLTTALMLIVCYDVFTRYLLHESSVALQELEWHLFALVFLLGAAYTLQMDEHVRVDVIYTTLSDYKKAWINFLGSVLLLIPFCIVAIIATKNFVINSYIMHETSPNPGGLPARYILKTFIPLSLFFLLLQGTSLALKSFIQIMNHKAAKNLPEAGK
jgi:TRAP-type mannitol/chloroaromatic compound transport system permease small subunit